MTVSTVPARSTLAPRAIGFTGAAALLACLALLAVGCASKGGAKTTKAGSAPKGDSKTAETKVTATPAKEKEPDHIQVQHILIGFAGSVPGKNITRSLEEAKAIAYGLLDSVKAGVSFDDLVVRHTDDRPPGIYGMSNTGVAPDQSKHEYARGSMVPAFGNVGFTLKVGDIGIADYDPRTSPYGYHVIKRLQ